MRFSLLTALLILISQQLFAQTTPLARLNCTSTNFPDCGGWNPVPLNQYHTRRLIPGAGPQGQNVIEFTQLGATEQMQYYLGWGGVILPDPAQGQRRYLRMRFRTVGQQILDGPTNPWSSKFIIVADGDPTSRLICALGDNGMTPDNLNIACARNIDNYPNATQNRVPLPSDTWVSLQMEYRSSSTTTTPDGRLSIWANQNNYNTPTTISGMIPLSSRGWGRMSIGFYANATIRAGSRVVFQLADIEIDDEFDPNWHRTGTSNPPPAAPRNLRQTP